MRTSESILRARQRRTGTVDARFLPRLEEVRATGAPAAINRKLHATSSTAGKGYDVDARAIAAVMVRHYGDEAEAVLARTKLFLDEMRRVKR